MNLETRVCPCGVCKPFKVLATSKQVYASNECEMKHKNASIGSINVQKRNYKSPPEPEMVGSADMARMLGVPPSNFNYHVRKRNIPFVRHVGNLWFKPSEVRKVWKESIHRSTI